MSYVLKSTKWPSILPDKKIQGLISGFYELMDNKEADAGHRLAEEIFTRDGKLVAATGTFAGSQEISESRKNAWGKVTARKHQVHHVFAHDDEGHDIMVIGGVEMTLANGNTLHMQFSCRFLVDEASYNAGNPRLGLVQVYADSAPMIAALKEI